jgi:hypothetical protein
MTIRTHNWLRPLAVMLGLALASTPVLASGWSLRGDATPVQRKETLWGVPRDDPAIAIGAMIVVGLFIAAVAWVAARVGDNC